MNVYLHVTVLNLLGFCGTCAEHIAQNGTDTEVSFRWCQNDCVSHLAD